MLEDLKGKVAVITGGAGGIGSATVRALANLGVSVMVWDLNEQAMKVVVDELNEKGGRCAADVVNVAESAEVIAAAERAERKFGAIDLLVNVAGGNAGTPSSLIDDMSVEDWNTVVGLNLSGPFYCTKACIEPMRRRGGGAIVNIASLASIRMSMNLGVSYTSAKAGVLGLTRHSAFDLAQHRIRVNAVLPGPVLTEPMRQMASKSELINLVPKQLPIGRWVEPVDIANAVLYFCSDMSSACTGTHVVVDGGLHIGNPSGTEIYFQQRRRPTKQ